MKEWQWKDRRKTHCKFRNYALVSGSA